MGCGILFSKRFQGPSIGILEELWLQDVIAAELGRLKFYLSTSHVTL